VDQQEREIKRSTDCLQRHSIRHGVINTLQIKGNQVAYKTKGIYNEEQKNGLDDSKKNIHQAVILFTK